MIESFHLKVWFKLLIYNEIGTTTKANNDNIVIIIEIHFLLILAKLIILMPWNFKQTPHVKAKESWNLQSWNSIQSIGEMLLTKTLNNDVQGFFLKSKEENV